MKNNIFINFFVILTIWAAPQCGLAQTVPPLINYQGKLVSSNGLPVSTGDYQLSFRIFDASTNGNLIWGPQVFNGQTGPGLGPIVSVVQGWFNVNLGPVDTNGYSIADAFAGTNRFVEIQLGTAPFVPRQQILSTPYALRAHSAANADTAQVAVLAQSAISASNVVQSPIPAGVVIAFAGSVAPSGWLLCDGSTVSRIANSNLFSVIGITHGSGDGSATFNLPDYRGRTLVGMDGGQVEFNSLGKAGGEKSHTLTISEMPSHNHSKQSWRGGYNGGGDWIWAWNAGNGNTGLQYTDNSGGDQPHNNLQPYRTVNYLIKN